jgi:hypothetical protein
MTAEDHLPSVPPPLSPAVESLLVAALSVAPNWISQTPHTQISRRRNRSGTGTEQVRQAQGPQTNPSWPPSPSGFRSKPHKMSCLNFSPRRPSGRTAHRTGPATGPEQAINKHPRHGQPAGLDPVGRGPCLAPLAELPRGTRSRSSAALPHHARTEQDSPPGSDSPHGRFKPRHRPVRRTRRDPASIPPIRRPYRLPLAQPLDEGAGE